jgi:hypothetical protein
MLHRRIGKDRRHGIAGSARAGQMQQGPHEGR